MVMVKDGLDLFERDGAERSTLDERDGTAGRRKGDRPAADLVEQVEALKVYVRSLEDQLRLQHGLLRIGELGQRHRVACRHGEQGVCLDCTLHDCSFERGGA